MEMVTFEPATALSAGELTRLLNRAYADYAVPVWINREQFERMCRNVSVDLALSVVAIDKTIPVGLALLSRRGAEGWISGVGVRPAWRRRGIAQRIVQLIQHRAQELGLERLSLEVLAQNEAALSLYNALAFTQSRTLLVLTLKKLNKMAESSVDIGPADPYHLLSAYSRFHDVVPSWQRALPSLQSSVARLQGLALCEDGQLVGYLLYVCYYDVIAVLDLAVDPAHPRRTGVARLLLMTLHRSQPGLNGHVINVPSTDPLLGAFLDVGYELEHRQYEMVWQVSADSGRL